MLHIPARCGKRAFAALTAFYLGNAACTVFTATAPRISENVTSGLLDFFTNMSVTEQLIEKVKEYPILYDLSHADYKNVRKKDKVWDEIGAALNEDGKLIYLRCIFTCFLLCLSEGASFAIDFTLTFYMAS